MWTKENRAKYNRDHLRYPSDLTDDEWTLVLLVCGALRHQANSNGPGKPHLISDATRLALHSGYPAECNRGMSDR